MQTVPTGPRNAAASPRPDAAGGDRGAARASCYGAGGGGGARSCFRLLTIRKPVPAPLGTAKGSLRMGAACMDAGDRRFEVVRRAAFALAALAVVSIALAARADAYVYWTHLDTESIGRANPDGTGVNPNFIPAGSEFPGGVAVDSTYIYWVNADAQTIGRANLDGTGINQSFIATDFAPIDVAVDGQHIYWSNSNENTIGRANVQQVENVNQSFITNSAASSASRRCGGRRRPHLPGEQPKQRGRGEPDDRASQPRRLGRQPELHHGRQHTRGDRGRPRRHLLVEHRSPRGLDRTRQHQRRRRQREPRFITAAARSGLPGPPLGARRTGGRTSTGRTSGAPRSGGRISTARAPKVPSSLCRRQ